MSDQVKSDQIKTNQINQIKPILPEGLIYCHQLVRNML